MPYEEAGLDAALFDDERRGRPIDFDDRERSRIVAMVCSDPPQGYYRWTLDLIADEAEHRELIDRRISRESVRIILQEHDLKPWRKKLWCIGALNADYIRKMEDVLDVYELPYHEKYPVVCLVEKPVALIADTRERIGSQGPGDILKKDYEYERNGSVNVFCAVEPRSCSVEAPMDTTGRKMVLPKGARAVAARPPRRMRGIAEKRAIVEETLEPGASVAVVARAHEVNANLVFGWRKLYRQGLLEPESETLASLLPVKLVPPHRAHPREASGAGVMEIELASGNRLQLHGRVDLRELSQVIEMLRRR